MKQASGIFKRVKYKIKDLDRSNSEPKITYNSVFEVITVKHVSAGGPRDSPLSWEVLQTPL